MDPSVIGKQVASRSAILLCQNNTAALRKVNKQILSLLDRLPLRDQRDVVKLHNLIDEQEKQVKVRIKGQVPLRIEIFNDNERYRANHLRRRFVEAQRKNKIRAIKYSEAEEEVYFGNQRSLLFHLPECRWVQKISLQDIVLFKTIQEAMDQKYVPCKVSKP